MNWTAIRISLVVAALSGAWLHGYGSGGRAAEARHEAAREKLQRDLFAAGEELSRRGAELAELTDGQDLMVRGFEDEVRGNSADNRPGIGADGMRALERLWGAP